MKIDDLRTGDILFFDEHPDNACDNWFVHCIKKCTSSRYSHCAYVLRWKFNLNRDEIYLWESSYHPPSVDPVDSKKNKFGVQITPLSYYTKNYPGRVDIYVRQRDRNLPSVSKFILEEIRHVVYEKPYDIRICDWVKAKFRCGPKPNTKRFWCSALLGYILCYNNDIESCDWSALRAEDFSSTVIGSPVQWKTYYGRDEPLEYDSHVLNPLFRKRETVNPLIGYAKQ